MKSAKDIEYNDIPNKKTDWNEQLNMAFVTKVFKPESSYFANLGKIWEF